MNEEFQKLATMLGIAPVWPSEELTALYNVAFNAGLDAAEKHMVRRGDNFTASAIRALKEMK